MRKGDHEEDQTQHLEQLKAQLQHYQQRLAAQRQRNAALRQESSQKYGSELLALIEGDPRAKVVITTVVEKLVFHDEQGNIISKIDGIKVGQIVEVKLVEPPSNNQQNLSGGK